MKSNRHFCHPYFKYEEQTAPYFRVFGCRQCGREFRYENQDKPMKSIAPKGCPHE